MAKRFTKTDALKAILQAIQAVRRREKTVAMFRPFLTREADK